MTERDRRTFLKQAGAAVVTTVVAPLLVGCDGDEAASATDTAAADATTAAAPRVDSGPAQSDPDVPSQPPQDQGPVPDVPSVPVVSVTKAPWVMALPSGAVFMRFETREDIEVPVRIGGEDLVPTRETGEHGVDWPVVEDADEIVYDEKGTFTLHTLLISGAAAGQRHEYSVPTGPGAALSGSFLAPPTEPQPIRLAFIADTMWPNYESNVRQLASWKPDVLIHGGDIQYVSGLLDTWNGHFDAFSGVLSHALTQYCVGNHEYEWGEAAAGEYSEYYLRMCAPPAQQVPTRTYYMVNLGQVRLFVLDSENEYDADITLHDVTGAQYQWLAGELAKASQDTSVKAIIVASHRPYLCFGKTGMRRDAMEVLHPLFRDHGVALVLNGHNHAYERFELDGVSYVVDGGGGALLYAVNKQISEGAISADEEAWRLVGEKSYGCTRLDIAADGTISLHRWASELEAVSDEATIAPRRA